MTAFVRSVFSKVLMADPVFRRDERKTEAVAAHMTAVYFGLRVLVKANVSELVLRDVARAATAQFLD